jgi:sugar/nucleoside kinase (ribokinase family)
MKYLNPVRGKDYKYNHIIGTGGIGSGIFFSLTGNKTLGRNESRLAELLPNRDFCKMHIILHYLSVLLRAGDGKRFMVYPIGKVGNDNTGRSLIQKMEEAGMNTDHIDIVEGIPTLFSVCYQYPDHSGGNITTQNSSNAKVTPEDISGFFKKFSLNGKRGIILAAPEVSVAARIRLLEHGRSRGSLNIAGLLSAEAEEFRDLRGFELTDILSVNIDEARSIAQVSDENTSAKNIVEVCIETLRKINPRITVLVTTGAEGCYCYHDGFLEHKPAIKVPVISTAGAGDAFLAGTIAGICCRLPLLSRPDGRASLQRSADCAIDLGILLASLSVTCGDTIHPDADANLLSNFAIRNNVSIGTEFTRLFNNSQC